MTTRFLIIAVALASLFATQQAGVAKTTNTKTSAKKHHKKHQKHHKKTAQMSTEAPPSA